MLRIKHAEHSPEIKTSTELKKSQTAKKTSSSLNYFKSLFPQLSISTNLNYFIKGTTLFHFISHLPKTTANTLYLLVEGINYAASSNQEVLNVFKTKVINTCPTQVTLLDGPQGNYTDFNTMSCLTTDASDSLTLSISNSTNTEPLMKCAIDFINEITTDCDFSEMEVVLIFGALALIGVTIIGSCFVKHNRQTTDLSLETPPENQETSYRPLSPGGR